MVLCRFSKRVGGPCGATTDYPTNIGRDCDTDVKGHLKFHKISDDFEVLNESTLLLARAGKQYLTMLCYECDIAFIACGFSQ